MLGGEKLKKCFRPKYFVFGLLTLFFIFLAIKLIVPASALGAWVQNRWDGGIGPSLVNQYSSSENINIEGNYFSTNQTNLFSNGDMSDDISGWAPIQATGGEISEYVGDGENGVLDRKYRVHSFTNTGSSTFNIQNLPVGALADVLIVAGGGGAGHDVGGGGGGGGVIYLENYEIANSSISVQVGAGGAAGNPYAGANGGNSIFGSFTAIGGGGGGGYSTNSLYPDRRNGKIGGSGGGGGYGGASLSAPGGAGTPSQGYAGGNGLQASSPYVAGAGGGFMGIGQNASVLGALGGEGLLSYITGQAKYYGCGGSAGGWTGTDTPELTTDNRNCGGAGRKRGLAFSSLQHGVANTGGGGGGGGNQAGGNGGSGIVVVRYPMSDVSHSNEFGFNNSAGSILVDSTNNESLVYQNINLGNNDDYSLIAYAYMDNQLVGEDDIQLMVGGEAITTSYSSVGGGWYKLTANIKGSSQGRSYGVLVKKGRTVYLDNISLFSADSAENGVLTSNVYDLGFGGDWGLLDYSYLGSGSVGVRVRSGNDLDMSDASDWQDCPFINSGSDLTDSGCMVDNTRYVQYQVTLLPDNYGSPTFTSITIHYSAWDILPPIKNASAIKLYKSNNKKAEVIEGNWLNSTSPYFEWDKAEDDEFGSGIMGYCLYLGQDGSADISQTKGLLGTSPIDTNGKCQYAVVDEFIDTSQLALSKPLVSSNSKYYLLIKAIDNVGNVYDDLTETFSFYFDNTPPKNPEFIHAPSQFLSSKDITLTWVGDGSASAGIYDGHSGVAGLQYRIGLGGTWFGLERNGNQDLSDLLPNNGFYKTSPEYDYDLLQDGNNIIYFRTLDNAGNISLANITAVVRLNSSAPSSPQDLVASPVTNSENIFSFSWLPPASYIGEVNLITYCYTINTLPNINNCNFTAPGQLSLSSGAYATQPGENTLYLVAKDESGNINYATAANVTFYANTPSPGIPVDIDIADVSVKLTSNWKLAITWDEPIKIGAGVANYKIYRSLSSDSGFVNIATTSGTSYVDSGLIQSNYYYYVRACDSANNCGAQTSIVDKTPNGRYTSPPDLISNPSVIASTRKAIISWTTDRDSDTRVQFGTETGKYRPTEFSISNRQKVHQIELSGLDAGTTYFYRAKWGDEDGNIGVNSELSFTTLPAPKLKDINVIKTGLYNATIQFTVTGAVKADIYYGKNDSFGGRKTINTSSSESTYAVELEGLDDGSAYVFKIDSIDADGFSYDGNLFSFSTPPRPKISNLRFQPIDGEPTSTQKVTWSTNVPANSVITYGISGTNGTDILSSELVIEHEITMKGLKDDSQYFLLAQSRDVDGNLAVSDSQTFKTAMDTRPPKISNINVETLVRGNGAEAKGQIIVSWTTDEPASSQVAFGEGSDDSKLNNKTPEDSNLSTEHIVIISDLATSRAYTVQPISSDKAGNESLGETRSAIISRATDSVMTLALNALRKLFGF